MKNSITIKPLLCSLAMATLISCGKDDDSQVVNTPPEISTQNFNVSELSSDTAILGKVLASDKEGDDLIFSLQTNGDGLFEISNNGELSLVQGKSLDFNAAERHNLSVDVTDGEFTSNAVITLNVIDENSAPLFSAQNFTVDENVALGSLVGNLIATDPDADALTFTWAPNQSISAFELVTDMNGGSIRTANNAGGNLDFETTEEYVVSVIASDGTLTTQADLTITVADTNDLPVFIDNPVFTVAEDISDGVTIARDFATDQDSDPLNYVLQSDPSNLFQVTDSGIVSLQLGKSLDFETATTHTLSINVNDQEGTIVTGSITINVTDVDESNATVSTFSGTGRNGNTDSAGGNPSFNFPGPIARDSQGNLYVGDRSNQTVRKISASGNVTTLDLGGSRVVLGLAVHSSGDLYISDFNNHVILKLTPSGTLTTVAGRNGIAGFVNGSATNSRFRSPVGIAFNDIGELIVADAGNHSIRVVRVNGNGGTGTVAGTGLPGAVDGATTSATFNSPKDIAVSSNGTIYVADDLNHRIRRIRTNGTVDVWAGFAVGSSDGSSSNAGFNRPSAIAIDGNDNIYVADALNHTIRKIEPNRLVTSLSRNTQGLTNGDLLDAQYNNPTGIEVDVSNNLYVGDSGNHVIRFILLRPGLQP